MIASVNRLIGSNDCHEAVLLQERSLWPLLIFIPAAVLVGFVCTALLALPAVLMGAIVGGIVGLGFAANTTYWIVARCGTEVILARSSKWRAKAVEIVERLPAPVPVTVSKGTIQSKVAIAGMTLMLARQFGDRFDNIVR